MNQLIRCFVAVEIPEAVLNQIEEYTHVLKQKAPQLRWIRPGAMHLTLRFLGEINESTVEKVRDLLFPVRNLVRPFELTAEGSGFFPSVRKPRVLWIGLRPDSDRSLFIIQQWIEESLTRLGFKKEKRRFSPHITLARIKDTRHAEPLIRHIEQNPFETAHFYVNEVNLMRSRLRPQGAEYSVIESFPLNKPA